MIAPGDRVAGRFLIEALAGSGGMGDVYRAIDSSTGGSVALKVLRPRKSEHAQRFAREALVLAELEHPSIVRYLAHGVTEQLAPYVAMEWLEGEDLGARLRREGVRADDALAVVGRVAEALAVLHRRGIVHRDVKPSNVFLVDGSLERIKLLDFGVARLARGGDPITTTGATLGTPGYMSPEQARGERGVGPASDVFSLGCLLFKCLTGRLPFEADDELGVLLKLVLEPAPHVRELQSAVPVALEELCADMLAKAPEQRPRDAEVLLAAIAALGSLGDGGASLADAAPPSLTKSELRLMCLVLARPRRIDPDAESTIALADLHERDDRLAAEAKRHGGRLDVLADRTMMVSLSGPGTPTDLAARGARCALAMRETLSAGARIAIVAAHGVISERAPIREVIQRGVGLLGSSMWRDAGGTVRIDDVVAGLLDARFDVRSDDAGLSLVAERDAGDTSRTLLGKPTPCVGRDRELASLEATLDESVAEPVARAVLVIAGAGVGKSRLRLELLKRVDERRRDRPVQVWVGRGDPMSSGSPLGLLASALRQGLGLQGAPDPASARRRLRDRVGRHFEGAEAVRVTEFVGELAGIAPDVESATLSAARRDAMLMGDQLRRAWEDLLAAECHATPVLLVLEDLHWGDLPTVTFVDGALRSLPHEPWMVLALARPEVHETFPRLWAEREVQEMRLASLTARAAERLVRDALGEAADAATVARLVERAAGNAFYLEELVRAVAEGRGEVLPETVLAMAAARLDGLDAEARRVLRAGSVFGQVFWRGAVGALLGDGGPRSRRGRDAPPPAALDWLDVLAGRELVTRRSASRFAGETELVFRHALVREASYATLTDADRALGHRLAAIWLEEAGETDAALLAEHAQRGGEHALALRWYIRAAQHALGANDFAGALVQAERGLACAAELSPTAGDAGAIADVGEQAGMLHLVRAEAHRWRGQTVECRSSAEAATARLRPGSQAWCAAAAELATSLGKLGETDGVAALARVIRTVAKTGGGSALVITAARAAAQLLYAGRVDEPDALLADVEGLASVGEPLVMARLQQVRSIHALFSGDTAGYVRWSAGAADHFETGGDLRNACMQRANVAYGYVVLGLFEDAEKILWEVHSTAKRMGLVTVVAIAAHNLGLVLARVGRVDEGAAMEAGAVESLATQGDRRLEAVARLYLAIIHRIAGRLAEALAEARAARELAASSTMLPLAIAMVARMELSLGETAPALASAESASAALDELGAVEEGEAEVRLVRAEALSASGRRDEALDAIVDARERLLARAAKITDAAWRESFLTRVPENARTLDLAAAWGVKSGPSA